MPFGHAEAEKRRTDARRTGEDLARRGLEAQLAPARAVRRSGAWPQA